MVIIAYGGRNFADRDFVFATLDAVHGKVPITLLRHGAAPGADSLAGAWAETRGVPVDPVPAGWAKYGRSAGPRRNRDMMVREPVPTGGVEFPGGRGTADMRGVLLAAGCKVYRPTYPAVK